MTDGSETLYVVQTDADIPEHESARDTFVIESELDTVAESTVEHYFDLFANAEISSSLPLPWYRFVWNRMADSQPDDYVRLSHLAILADRLSNTIESGGYAHVAVGDVDRKYRAMLADVCDHHGIDISGSTPDLLRERLLSHVLAVFGVGPFLLDQLFSIVYQRVVGDRLTAEVVFAPAIGRFDTMRPIIEAMPHEDRELVITPMTVSHLLRWERFADVDAFGPTSFSRFTTVRSVARQLSFLLVAISREFFLARTTEAEICDLLQAETGLCLDNSVSLAVNRQTDAHTYRSFLYYYLSTEMCADTGCSKLVVGSMSPIGKAILAGAVDSGVSVFHNSHSSALAVSCEPPFGAVRFLAGDFARSYYSDLKHVNDMEQFETLGRPYLDMLYHEISDHEVADEESVTVQVLIATQPHEDDARETFVKCCLEAVARLPAETSVTVKTHPGESAAFYRERFADLRVVETGLYDELARADLVLTVNSNVGIEAMMSGAACICFNVWSVFIRPMSYSQAEQVPHFTDREAFVGYFATLSPDEIDRLVDDQARFVEENYLLDGRTHVRIAEYIAAA